MCGPETIKFEISYVASVNYRTTDPNSPLYIDVHNTSIEICDKHIKIRIGELLKTSKYGCHLNELYIQHYPIDVTLCVVKVLQLYLEFTENLRGNETRLFISYQKPHKSVTRSTLGRWIKSVLTSAGINMSIFSPHSTRSASTSLASSKVPIDTVLRTAGWKSDFVFRKYYKRETTNSAAFAHSVLSEHKTQQD